MMGTDELKVVVLFAQFIITLIASSLPFLLMRKLAKAEEPSTHDKYEQVISILGCFGGGIFLGTCLLDLFPEVEEQLKTAFAKLKLDIDFPLAQFITVFGFLLVLTIEQVLLTWKESSSPESQPLLGHSHSPNYKSINHDEEAAASSDHAEIAGTPGGDEAHYVDPLSHSLLRCILLVVALSLHSVFEGFAIGLQGTEDDVLAIFGAVIIHKCVIAFTLGLNIVQSKLSWKKAIICNIIFSAMSPIGIAISIPIIDRDHNVSVFLISGVLQGIACGTFLYVTFFEVLPHEFQDHRNRLLKLLFVILGFAVVCVLVFQFP